MRDEKIYVYLITVNLFRTTEIINQYFKGMLDGSPARILKVLFLH